MSSVKTTILFDWLYGYKKGDPIQLDRAKYEEMRDLGIVQDVDEKVIKLETQGQKGGCSDC